MVQNKLHIYYKVLGGVCGVLLMALCTACGGGNVRTRAVVDSLNAAAHEWEYRNLDSARGHAQKALALAGKYSSGKAEALNHLSFVSFREMDFANARRYAKEAARATDNQVELLLSDVALMRVCQRISTNKEYYDYRNSAAKRIKRIREEWESLPPREQKLFTYAENEFGFVSVQYHLTLEQLVQAREELAKLNPDADLIKDTVQLTHYYYLRGNGKLCQGVDNTDFTVREVDGLIHCLTLAYVNKYDFYYAAALQAFAEMMLRPGVIDIIKEHRSTVWNYLNDQDLPDANVPAYLAHKALLIFQQNADMYHTADTYKTLAQCAVVDGNYHLALDYLTQALDIVNKSFFKYYGKITDAKPLVLFNPKDKKSTLELEWLNNPNIEIAADWIAGIREQLSVTYSALNQKPYSDYNRNAYLDILAATRQDLELKNRSEQLDREARMLNILLYVVLALLVLLVAGLLYFNHRWHKRHRRQTQQLRQTLDACRKITSMSLTEEELDKIAPPSDTVLRDVQQSYIDWAKQNRAIYQELGNERERLQEEYAMHRLHIAENKRQNVEKRAKLSLVNGIMPYLDRMLNEAKKLSADDTHRIERLNYIGELASHINVDNDILTQWIQLSRGDIDLHVESFALQPLFDIIGKSRRSFEQKGLSLQIAPTQAAVKADRVLTLFMLNTLADNARKFTPANGTISLFAEETADYVEVSVQDNGVGLSEQDIHTILDEKVYDARQIGAEHKAKTPVRGHGFGLMNCKGIIEKYRKTNALFAVCRFGVESHAGAGSRFFFRLPKGVQRVVGGLAVLLTLGFSACTAPVPHTATQAELTVPHDTLLVLANHFVDLQAENNISGRYEDAFACADSAIAYFNAYHHKQHPNDTLQMKFSEIGPNIKPAEVAWWNERLSTDYATIKDLRNELAVSALALHNLPIYVYNNLIYRRLYKLTSEDKQIEEDCATLKTVTENRHMSLVLLILLCVLIVAGYYFIIVRRRMMFGFKLRQVLEVNNQILNVLSSSSKADEIHELPLQMLARIFPYINEIHGTKGLALLLYDEDGHLFTECNQPAETATDEARAALERAYKGHETIISPDGKLHVYPLLPEGGAKGACIGAFAILLGAEGITENDALFDELVVRYMAIILFQTVIHRQRQYDTLEEAEDERRRASYEESTLHVQNMVLDNCLSTLKHETMYYPNRIRQLVAQIQANPTAPETSDRIQAMSEVMDYYKLVFSLLSSQAERQVEQVNFHRERVDVGTLLSDAERYFMRQCRKRGLACTLQVQSLDAPLSVCGDAELLHMLFENLMQGSLAKVAEGEMRLCAQDDGAFVRFRFTDTRTEYTAEQLSELFYPDINRISYLLCKQIVRDHDEFSGHCGCRINAEAAQGGGFAIWFTIPKNETKWNHSKSSL